MAGMTARPLRANPEGGSKQGTRASPRAGDPLRRHLAQGLGWQPDLGRGAGAVGPDVGVADLLAAGALGPGLPEPTPSRWAGDTGLAPLTRRTHSHALKRRWFRHSPVSTMC